MPDAQIDELARAYLTGAEGEGRSTDSGPLDGLFRDWQRIGNTPHGKALGEAIARRIGDADAELRYRALQFLHAVPKSDLTRAVIPFIRGDRSSFKGVYLNGDDKDLEFWLLWVMAKLIGTDGEARDLARKEALDPNGQPAPIAAELAFVDGDWVRQHRDDIIRLHPDTKDGIDNNLK